MAISPIILSTEEVQSILKEMIEPIYKVDGLQQVNKNPNKWELLRLNDGVAIFKQLDQEGDNLDISCPYGPVGDSFWVNEAARNADTG